MWYFSLLFHHHSISFFAIYLPPCFNNVSHCEADSFKAINLVPFIVFNSSDSVSIVVSCLLAEHIAAFVLQFQHKSKLWIVYIHQSQVFCAAQRHSHYNFPESLSVLHMQSELIVPEIPIDQNLIGWVLRFKNTWVDWFVNKELELLDWIMICWMFGL